MYTTKQSCDSGQTRSSSLEEEIERAMLACRKGRIKKAIAIVNAAEKRYPAPAIVSDVKKRLRSEIREQERERVSFETKVTSARDLQKILSSLPDRYYEVENKTDDLIEVRIEDVERHVVWLRDDYFLHLFVEAVDFAKEKKTWNFWECCDKKFADSMSYTSHFVEKHDFNITRDDDLKKYLPEIVDDESVEMIMNGIWKPVDIASATEIVLNNINVEPPFCNDRQRTELLVAIRDRFQVLLNHGCLTKSHVWWAIRFTLEEFGMDISLKQFRKHGLLALKVLGYSSAPQLEKILNFLKSLAGIFQLSESGKPSEINYIDNRGDEVCSVNLKVIFSEDLSCLLMEKQVLLRKLQVKSSLESWRRIRESQKRKAKEVFDIYEKESLHLRKLLVSKSKLMNNIGVGPEFKKFSYLSYLRKRKRELQIELDALSDVESCLLKHYFIQTGLAMPPYFAYEFEFEEFPDEIKQKEMYENEKKKEIYEDILQYDAMIMRSVSVLNKYKQQLRNATPYDYQSIIFLLLKSFMENYDNFNATVPVAQSR